MAKTQSRQYQFVYTCNNCNSNVETRWHCTVCDDLNLCFKCYTKDGLVHEMQKLGFEPGNDSTGEDKKQINLQEPRHITYQRQIEHACQCSDVNCGVIKCQEMKRIVRHAKKCKRRKSGICQICRKLIALNCLHSKNCLNNKCPVPFCLSIKNKLKQQRMEQQKIPKPQSQMMGFNNMPNPAGAAPGPGVDPSRVMATPETSCFGSKQRRNQSNLLFLEHDACKCSGVNCGVIKCQKMKTIVLHAKKCKRRESGICQICRKLIALNCLHSKNCLNNKCPVPFCFRYKRQVKKQRMAQQKIPKPQSQMI